MPRRFIPVAVVLLGLLCAAAVLAYRIWDGVGAVSMGVNGILALIAGAVGSLVLGGGLMALVFISARRGYDDAADLANEAAREERET